MTSLSAVILTAVFLFGLVTGPAGCSSTDHLRGASRPIVIAHRGASGYRPEHTLAAYELAIQQGADFIEPDLVLTRDGHLIARHDNQLDLTTNVASQAEFADRRTTKSVDGKTLTGWFAEDFTLEEIKRLRAIERIPQVRPDNVRYDGQFEIPTFDEIIELAQRHQVGLYPETKHPTHIQAATGLDMSLILLDRLQAHGIRTFADLPVYIQSFEVGNLQALNAAMTQRGMDLPLVQLLGSSGAPFDVRAAGGGLTYDAMATPEGLAAMAAYADGVGPAKDHFILPRDADQRLDPDHETNFVADAHAAGLLVHPYTFRAENQYLARNHRIGTSEQALGDLEAEIRAFLKTGIDGFFVDHPDFGVAAVNDRVD